MALCKHTTKLSYALSHGRALIDPPSHSGRKSKDMAGEWWELWDDNHNLPYYYNTVSCSSFTLLSVANGGTKSNFPFAGAVDNPSNRVGEAGQRGRDSIA